MDHASDSGSKPGGTKMVTAMGGGKYHPVLKH